MWRDVFGERQWCGRDIFVQEVDIVAFRIRRIIVEREIAGQHSIQNNTATPDVHLLACIERVTHHKFWRSVARASATGLHQIASSHPFRVEAVQLEFSNKVFVGQIIFNLVGKLIDRVEGVREPKICDDDIPILVEQEDFPV